MLFKRRKRKYTFRTSLYRDPLLRRTIFKRRVPRRSPKIYRRTYREKKLATSAKAQKYFYLSLIVLIIGFLLYFALFSNFFKIEKIAVIGNESVTQEQIEEIVWPLIQPKRLLVFPGRNIFLVNAGQIKSQILEKILQVEAIEISRRYPDVLKVIVKEKEAQAIWVTEDRSYYLDANGVICYEISKEILEDTELPIIQDDLAKPVLPKEVVTRSELVRFVLEIQRRFQPKTGYKIALFKVPSGMADEVHAKTEQGWEIYFNIGRDPLSQLNDLAAILEHEIKDRIGQINYIDLRIESWIYYK